MIITKKYPSEKRNFGETIIGDFSLNKYLYLNKDFNLDGLFEYGFGWCEKYCSDGGAYEIFIDDEKTDVSLRVYYIPNRHMLRIEYMGDNDVKEKEVIINFILSLMSIGMLTTEKGIKLKYDIS